jgi:hypothetical protein
MVRKTAIIGAPVLIAISAPTALAVRTAQDCNVTLVAVARGTSSQIFTHPWRFEREIERSAGTAALIAGYTTDERIQRL